MPRRGGGRRRARGERPARGARRTRRVVGVLVAAPVALGLALLLVRFAVNEAGPAGIAIDYTARTVADTGAINTVTAILLDYRALDTLGEASVIFAAAAAVGTLFAGARPPGERALHSRGLGIMVRRLVGYLAALFWLFPVYVILYGHLSPGGGFQGGVSLAVLWILLNVVFGTRAPNVALPPRRLHAVEAGAAAAFLAVGLVGIARGSYYLANASAGFPLGSRPGQLFGAGFVPLLNLIIGAKVAAGLGSIFTDIQSGGDA